MIQAFAQRALYSRPERLSDAAVHWGGLGLAALGVPVLIHAVVTQRGDGASIAAVALYGACLMAMLGFSALYNVTQTGRWTPIWRRLDHSAIFMKIAGTFTPLVALSGAAAGSGGPLLIGLWCTALGGTSLKVLAPDRLRWLGLVLYLGMGWIGVYAGADVVAALAPEARRLVVLGGTLYTLGVAFYLWQSLPFHTTIWHVFVLVASASFYFAILAEVANVH